MRFNRILALSLLFILSLMATVAVAADLVPAHVNPAPAALADFLQQTVFPVLGALFMGVVTLFLNRLGAKYKIDLLMQRDNFLERVAFQGLTLAEEKAAKYAGSKMALTGNDKMDVAIAHILRLMPKVDEGHARAVVESLLAQIPGVGASGVQAVVRDSLVVPAPTIPTPLDDPETAS